MLCKIENKKEKKYLKTSNLYKASAAHEVLRMVLTNTKLENKSQQVETRVQTTMTLTSLKFDEKTLIYIFSFTECLSGKT